MELSYSELIKRDVINVVDGKCLGRIVDIKLVFPAGKLEGIYVPGYKGRGLFRIFDKSRLYIEERKILKIGGDVILVEVKCGDTCEKNTKLNPPSKPPCPPNAYHPNSPCPPEHHRPQPPYPPQQFNQQSYGNNQSLDLSGMFDQSGRIDTGDY